MSTKKLYKKIAQAIKAAKLEATRFDDDTEIDDSNGFIDSLQRELGHILSSDNPSFDYAKFNKACE